MPPTSRKFKVSGKPSPYRHCEVCMATTETPWEDFWIPVQQLLGTAEATIEGEMPFFCSWRCLALYAVHKIGAS